MRFFIVSAAVVLLPGLVIGSPVPENATSIEARTLGQTGSYTVSGLGARKKQLIACGANELDMAIAMLETERMSTDYTVQLISPLQPTGRFQAELGHAPPECEPHVMAPSNDYNTGAELNSNLCLDISLRHESMNHFGEGLWFAGHRNGASGLANPNTQDIQNYKDGVYWIRNQLQYYNNEADMTSDVRFWVDVPAI